jgi:hypothetical protein
MAKSSSKGRSAAPVTGPGRAIPHPNPIGSKTLKPGATRNAAAPHGKPPTAGRTPVKASAPLNRFLLLGGDYIDTVQNDKGVGIVHATSFKKGEQTYVESPYPLDEMFAGKFTKAGPVAAREQQIAAAPAIHPKRGQATVIEDYDPDATLGEAFDIPAHQVAELESDEDEDTATAEEAEEATADEDEEADEEEEEDLGENVSDDFGSAEEAGFQVFKQGKVYKVAKDGKVQHEEEFTKKSEVTKFIKDNAVEEEEESDEE